MEFEIKNGIKKHCPQCGTFYSVENDAEILVRNITFIHTVKGSNTIKTKCRQCKVEIEIKS